MVIATIFQSQFTNGLEPFDPSALSESTLMFLRFLGESHNMDFNFSLYLSKIVCKWSKNWAYIVFNLYL